MESVTKAHIEPRPGKCGGKPCITGSRIRVQDIYVWHEIQGRSPVDIVGEYPELSLADVHAAIAYYFDNRERIERDIAEENAAYQTLKASSPSKVIQRLEATDGNSDQAAS
jgi:uncharacterized protein (DUF433 family)